MKATLECAWSIDHDEIGTCVSHLAENYGVSVNRVWTAIRSRRSVLEAGRAGRRLECDRRFKQNCIVPTGQRLEAEETEGWLTAALTVA